MDGYIGIVCGATFGCEDGEPRIKSAIAALLAVSLAGAVGAALNNYAQNRVTDSALRTRLFVRSTAAAAAGLHR